MKLIIDIPDELVTDIKDYCGISMTDAKKALPTILNAIHNGIPLNQIREEIRKQWHIRPKNKYEEGLKDQALKDIQIIDKYR